MRLEGTVVHLFKHYQENHLLSIRNKWLETYENLSTKRRFSKISLFPIIAKYTNANIWSLTTRLDHVIDSINKSNLNKYQIHALKKFNDRLINDYIKRICKLSETELKEIKEEKLYYLLKEKLNTQHRKYVYSKYNEIKKILEEKQSSKEKYKTAISIALSLNLFLPMNIFNSTIPVTYKAFQPAQIELNTKHVQEQYEKTAKTQEIRPNPAKLDSFQYPLEGYKALYPSNEAKGRMTNLPHTEFIPAKEALVPGSYGYKNVDVSNRGFKAVGEENLELKKEIPQLLSLEETLKGLPLNMFRGDSKKMLLTFDSSYQRNAADAILKTLDQYGIKSTFFLTGKFIESNPGLIKMMLARGHEVGNHTYSHPHIKKLSDQEFLHEIRKTEDAFFKVTGKNMIKFWRAPYGEYTEKFGKLAKKIGYTHIYWSHHRTREESLDSLDWVSQKKSKNYFTSDEIAEHIVDYPKKYGGGGIVLFHLGTDRKEDPVHKKLPEIIEKLLFQGYQLTKVSEAVKYRKSIVL